MTRRNARTGSLRSWKAGAFSKPMRPPHFEQNTPPVLFSNPQLGHTRWTAMGVSYGVDAAGFDAGLDEDDSDLDAAVAGVEEDDSDRAALR